ncbi:MAG TPA: LemA family protein, partial [Fibrobacteraceae bacterium]|nr:LemA family protein [Fibrobacteraceae bacterium]
IIAAEEAVKAQWAQVQNVYQRRADLVPNLAATVEGYAQHESATLAEVAQARAQMGGVIKPDASLLRDPVAMEKFQASQATFMGGLQRLMMVSERYPDLKANEQFNNMMVQLEGTENRISVERGRYNEAVQMFNTLIRQFPMSLVANFMHVQPFVPFAAKDTAQDAPVVKFNTGAPAVKPGEDPNPDRIH